GQVKEFVSLTKEQSRNTFGPGVIQQKTLDTKGESFGAGRCMLLMRPLGRSSPMALVSTTKQSAGEGLSARLSYLFAGMRELFNRLADAKLNKIVMPLLGAGHGRIDQSLALAGILLAIAEAASYGQGGQRLKQVTVVVFKADSKSPA